MDSYNKSELLTLDETCRLLKMSRPTVVKLINSGVIKGIKLGKRLWRIPRVEIDDFFKKADAATQKNNCQPT